MIGDRPTYYTGILDFELPTGISINSGVVVVWCCGVWCCVVFSAECFVLSAECFAFIVCFFHFFHFLLCFFTILIFIDTHSNSQPQKKLELTFYSRLRHRRHRTQNPFGLI